MVTCLVFCFLKVTVDCQERNFGLSSNCGCFFDNDRLKKQSPLLNWWKVLESRLWESMEGNGNVHFALRLLQHHFTISQWLRKIQNRFLKLYFFGHFVVLFVLRSPDDCLLASPLSFHPRVMINPVDIYDQNFTGHCFLSTYCMNHQQIKNSNIHLFLRIRPPWGGCWISY